MHRGTRSTLAALLVLASQAGDSGCEPTVKACEIDTRGIRVEHGLVTDVITATCDPQPLTHRLDGWLEYRPAPGDDWLRAGARRTSHTRPDAEGFAMPVNAGRCVPGQYRAAWQATGTGPHPGELPFNYTGGDVWGTTLDCEEG